MLPKECESVLTTILYPVMLNKDPLEYLDYVLYEVIDNPKSKLERKSTLEQIKVALASSDDLSLLVPGTLTDSQYREFLMSLQARLEVEPD